MKKCNKCLVEKEINLFPKTGSKCKECVAQYKKEYRETNKEKLKECSKEYYKNNKHEILVKTKQYASDNNEKLKEYRILYDKNELYDFLNKFEESDFLSENIAINYEYSSENKTHPYNKESVDILEKIIKIVK